MEIRKGKFLINRTKKYLLPSISTELGKVFKQKLTSQVWKLAVGLHDKILEDTNILKGKKAIFILVDKTVLPQDFKKFKDWITYKPYYITDYQYDYDKHMFVIEIPKNLEKAYDKFNVGRYSEMYTKEELDLYFTDKNTDEYKVLSKSLDKRKEFLKEINERFEVNLTESDIKDSELDFPPSIDVSKEVFNYE